MPIRHIAGRFRKKVVISVRNTENISITYLIYVIQTVLCKLFEVPLNITVNIATVLRAGQQRNRSVPGGASRLFSKASREFVGPKYRPFPRVSMARFPKINQPICEMTSRLHLSTEVKN
jgi:hypothetical protein